MTPSTPSPAWEQVYKGINCLRIVLEPDDALLALVQQWREKSRQALDDGKRAAYKESTCWRGALGCVEPFR